jgi:hypothetical protein
MLTPMNIAIIGGVLVLLLLMVKMRKDRTAAAKPASAEKERRRSRRADRAAEPKVKEAKGRRGRRGQASIEAATSEVAATTASPAQETSFAEPTVADAGWVDGIDHETPVAEQSTDTFVPPRFDAAAPAAAWTDDEVVSAPGWPTPGEMDGGWAIEGDAAPVAAPGDEWIDEPAAVESTEDALAVDETVATAAPEVAEVADVAEFPVVAENSWDEEGFDPAAGWGDDAEEAAPVAAEPGPTPVVEDADADWATEWSDEAPAAATETPAPEAVEYEVTPAADEPDDTWAADGWDDEPVAAPEAETVSETPVAEAVEDWASDDSDDWSAPAGEATAEGVADAAPEWDLATEEAAAAVAPEAPVFETESTPSFDENPYADDAYEVFDDTPGPAPEGRSLDALFGFTSEEPAADEVEAAFETSAEPVFEAAFETPAEPVFEAAFEEPAADEVEAAFETPAEPVFEAAFEEPAAPEVEYDAPAEPAGRFEDPRTEQPLDQWASLSPVTAAAPAVTVDPAARWSTIAPITPKVPVPADPAARWAAITPIAPAAGAPQRDRHDDDLSGRFALGGFAVGEGHQVVTGVTFRFAADEAPTSWVFGPSPNAAPGTLVIDVEGVLNCTAADVEVLDDPGFAPTTNGFTLRLTAPAGGPFAASGTYHVV